MLKNLPKLFVIISGTVVWSLTMVKSGLVYSYGAGFWGPNGHDGIWHVSLITSLAQGRLDMPIFAGELIKNYHIGFDLFLAIIHRLTFIPVSILYFQIFPPLYAFAIGWLVYKYILLVTSSSKSAWWATFFTYFGGSWGWILSRGESTFWAQQAISTLLNPPYALSLIILLLGLIAIHRHHSLGILLSFGLLAFVKVYAGILGFACLGLLAIKNRKLIPVLLGSAILAAVLYFPLNRSADKLLVYQPGWFLETLMGLSDRLNWPRFYSAMVNYKASHNYLKGVPAYFVALVIFVLGNLGTRVFGVFSIKKTYLHLFAFVSLVVGVLFPMLFLQSGTPWNTIQFFYYTQFFLGLLAGVFIGNWKLRFHWDLGFGICVLLLTIPTTADTLRHYLPSQPPAKISTEEMDALRYLSKLPRGTVLTAPISPNPYAPAPRPLYHYESTAYVSAYSGQPVFVEDEVNLNITGFDWRTRRAQSEALFAATDLDLAQQFLTSANISYIYLPSIALMRPILSDTQLGGRTVFENSQVAVIALQ